MKRRIVSLLVSLILCLNLCPMRALASVTYLPEDKRNDRPYRVTTECGLVTGDYILTGTAADQDSATILVTNGGNLHLQGNVVSINGYGVRVESGGKLHLEATTSITGGRGALDVADVNAVSLEEGCACFDEKGNVIAVYSIDESVKTITVKQCTEHKKTYAPVIGTPTHNWKCAYCGVTGAEKCTFTLKENGKITCGHCRRELTLSWKDSNSRTVSYDGAPVEASILPDVTITITPEKDNWKDYLQYSYKKRGDANYTPGLPKDAGTYDVIVSLPELPNFEGVVSDPITLTVEPIDPTVESPPVATTPTYNRNPQELVTAGTLDPLATANDLEIQFATAENGPFSTDIPTATDAGTYQVWYKVVGQSNNYKSQDPVEVKGVEIQRKSITPVVELEYYTCQYDNGDKEPKVTVKDDDHITVLLDTEYSVEYTNNRNVGTATVTVTDSYPAKPDDNGITKPVPEGNYKLTKVEEHFEITPKVQDALSITQKPDIVTYGDTFTLNTSGGSGNGDVTWEVTGGTDVATVDKNSGQVTIKGVGTATVTATKPGAVPTRTADGNYETATASWTFTSVEKPVTAEVTVAAKNWDGNTNIGAITATVKAADLAFSGDSVTISGLTGTYDTPDVGTGKTVTLTGGTVGGEDEGKYVVTVPPTTTASILAVTAVCTNEPEALNLTYDASQDQALVTAGATSDGTMVYSLDGTNFTQNIPKAKNVGTYTVYYKVQGDRNHTDSEIISKNITIKQQSIKAEELQIELSPPSAQYDGQVHQPAVKLLDPSNNVIPTTEYKVIYVTEHNENWKDQGSYRVEVENVAGGNYVIEKATATFEISTSPQAPLEIVNKRGLVYYGDNFTLSTSGGSAIGEVTWSVDPENSSVVEIDGNGLVKIIGVGQATIKATKAGGGNYDTATATYPLNALKKPVTVMVTADDKVYNGNKDTTIHVTWNGLVGNDTIDTSHLIGEFESADAGTNKKVSVKARPDSSLPTSDKYDFTFPTTTASILKASTDALDVKANENLVYSGLAQELVTNGNDKTLYSDAKDGEYSASVPTKTNAGTYTVWYKQQGDNNYTDSESKSCTATIAPKTLADKDVTIKLLGNDLQEKDGTYYYSYDGTEKTPTVTVTIKDSGVEIPASEYTVRYRDNKNVTTNATVTIEDNPGGNYNVSGSITFEIREIFAVLTSSPQAKNLTYEKGLDQELVTVGTATGGTVVYSLTKDTDYSENIPKKEATGTYTVYYKVKGDANHTSTAPSQVSVTIQPKTVISPKVTVTGPYIYNGSEHKPTGTAVNVEDGGVTIPDTEYTLSYQDNVNAGTATVIVTDNNGGNYTVNGTGSFTIEKATPNVNPPTGRTNLTYDCGKDVQLINKGETDHGILLYSLNGKDYSPDIPTAKEADTYTVTWMVQVGQSDTNYKDTTPQTMDVTIDKAPQEAPDPPQPESITSQSITLKEVSGNANGAKAQYSIDGGAKWQDSPEFTGLDPSTEYTFVIRYGETDNYEASPNSDHIKITTEATSNTPSETGDNASENQAEAQTPTQTQSPTQAQPPSANNTPLQTTVRNSTAKTVLSTAGGNKLVSEAVQSRSDSIVIKPEVSGNVTKAQVTIPAATARKINSQTGAALTVSAPIADVTIPNEVLGTLGSAGGSVDVVTEQVGDAVKLTLSAGGETVESVPGGVTLKVPAQDATPGTVAMLVKEDGTRQVIRKSVAKDGAVIIPLDGSATVEIVDNSKDFEDVQATDWESDAVDFVSSRELFNGTGETTFSPDKEMSRGMLATVLFNLEGQPDQDVAVTFRDVSNEEWYSDAVAWATENGIVNGYGDGQYGPDNNITREQLAVMLWRYAGSPEAGDGQALAFTDADKASGYAQQALQWAVTKGVMNGYPNGQLNPAGTATRAQAAQMLKNFLEKA